MAETIFLADGSKEVILGDPRRTLRKVIRDKLGSDAENLFLRILAQERDL